MLELESIPTWLSLRDADSCLSLLAGLRPLEARYSLARGGPHPFMKTAGVSPKRRSTLSSIRLDGENETRASELGYIGSPESAKQVLEYLHQDSEVIYQRLPVLLERLGVTIPGLKFPLPLTKVADDWVVAVTCESKTLETTINTVIIALQAKVFEFNELPRGWDTSTGWPKRPIRSHKHIAERLQEFLGLWMDPVPQYWEGAERSAHRWRTVRYEKYRTLITNSLNALALWGEIAVPADTVNLGLSLPEPGNAQYEEAWNGYLYEKVQNNVTACMANIIFWIRHHEAAVEIAEYRKSPKLRKVSKKETKLKAAKDFILEHGPITAHPIAKHIKVTEEAFRSQYLPTLRTRGVRNDGEGYFCDPSA